MTAQIPHELRLGTRSLAIAGVHGDGLFVPTDRGWSTRSMSRRCYRGFVAKYALSDERLVLRGLHVAFAPASLALREPVFELEVRSATAQQRHEVRAFEVLIGSGSECGIQLAGEELPTHTLSLCRSGDRFALQRTPQRWERVRSELLDAGVPFALGGHVLTPRIVGGELALYTAEPPALDGARGRWVRTGTFAGSASYSRLGIPLGFTGGLLACDGYVAGTSSAHLGFHPALKFELVEELVFDDGRLTHREDVSDALAELRGDLAQAPRAPRRDAPNDEIRARIQRLFRLSYWNR